MRSLHFVFSSGALVLATAILFVSLSAGNSRALAYEGGMESSQKQFYLSQTILPDHVAYPILMAFDRAKLETASPQDQVYLQVEYANRRFEYAAELIHRENLPLALTTLTKAQKYLLEASRTVVAQETPLETQEFVYEELLKYQNTIAQLQPHFTGADQEVVVHHSQEVSVLQEQLKMKLHR